MTAANTHSIPESVICIPHVKKGILFFSPYNKEIGKDDFDFQDLCMDIPVVARQPK